MAQTAPVSKTPSVKGPRPKTSVTKPNISYAKPLYYLSLVNAMSCPIDMENYYVKSGKLHKIYSCFIIALILSANAFSLHGRLSTSYKFLIQTVIITEAIQQAVLLASNVYGIVNVLLQGQNFLQSYFDMLKRIDRQLLTTLNLAKKRVQFCTNLAISHLLLLLMFFYDYWTWSKALGVNVWLYYFFRLYSYYLSAIVVFQVCTFATALKLRFYILNERLFDVSVGWIGNIQSHEAVAVRDLFASYKKSSVRVQLDGLSLECLIKMHDLLCDIMDLLNGAFGFNVVLLVCNIIINSVIAFNLTLIFGTGVQEAPNSCAAHLIGLNILWALMFMAMGILVARSCDSASKEAWKSATIAYKLLACVPAEPTCLKEREIRVLLNQLASQIEHRRPSFDACGFFAVDHSMIYGIVGAISSYIVIIIQFNNTPIGNSTFNNFRNSTS